MGSAANTIMTPDAQRRIDRELRTVQVMIGMYCAYHHQPPAGLCSECQAVWHYAQQRIEHCPLRADKPTCVQCPVHCYKPALREQIRVVMRFAGPRMAWRHPILALFHLLDGRRQHSAPGSDSAGQRSQP